MAVTVSTDVPLAPFTTLELGGPARFFAQVTSETEVSEALAWAQVRGVPAFVFGGGSNLVVADEGFDGLVIRVATRGLSFLSVGDEMLVTAAAGEPWDSFVTETVARDLAGLECLGGIPGLVGATPVQNVGAYGQEVSERIRTVRVLDRQTRTVNELDTDACGFGYRDSAFKRAPDRAVVLSVTFALVPGGAPAVRYPELRAALVDRDPPTLGDVHAAVVALRRRKSMVIEPSDPNRRSVGSFFMNPIVSAERAEEVAAAAVAQGVAARPEDVPRFAAGPDAVKLAAGWLIERAGIAKGLRWGPVGISSQHALALVHHGGGRTADLLALARHVRDTVLTRFGITLVPEPVLLGARLDY